MSVSKIDAQERESHLHHRDTGEEPDPNSLFSRAGEFQLENEEYDDFIEYYKDAKSTHKPFSDADAPKMGWVKKYYLEVMESLSLLTSEIWLNFASPFSWYFGKIQTL